MLSFLKKFVRPYPKRAGLTLALATLTFGTGLRVLSWAHRRGGETSSKIERRLAYVQSLQAGARQQGSSAWVIGEEEPVPLIRWIDPHIGAESAAHVAADLKRNDGPHMQELGSQRIEVTNGKQTWNYRLR